MRYSTQLEKKRNGQCPTPQKEALERLLATFNAEMVRKTLQKYDSGVSGWDDENLTSEKIIERIEQHLRKDYTLNNAIDVAILAMFWYNVLY